MDSRDSSSAAGGSIADDDGHLSVTAGLSKDSGLLFQSRRYAECINVLNQLLQKKPDDPKVLHNIAVAEYYLDGCPDPRKLLEVLNKVKKISEGHAHSSGQQVDAVNNTGSGVISVSKGSSTNQHQFSAANTTNVSYTDEFDTSVSTLNIAIILFHLHEYANAFSVLEPSYQNIAPIDETTALHICLLLVDVALASRDALRAADVIQYLERSFGMGYMISQGDNGSSAQHQLINQSVKVSSAPGNLAFPDASNTDSFSGPNASESPLARTLSDEADYENLLSTLDITGQNLVRPAAISSSTDVSRTSAERPAPAVDLKLKLHLYKVRFLLLTRNLKAAKREVKLAMNIARCSCRDPSTALLLKSELEYARGNHRKAIKLLMTAGNRTESGMPSMFNNNLGCIYHKLGKHHISVMFFSKALKSSSSIRSEKSLKLATFTQDKSLLIVYNMGLLYLECAKPIVAARCFHKASSAFYNRPLLWLRLAECCLLALEKGFLTSNGATTNGDDIKVHVVGNGKWRQVVVEDTSVGNGHLDSLGEAGLVIGDDQQKLSIPYAQQCLLNALHLLNVSELKSSKASISISALEEDESSQAVSAGLKNSNHKNLSSGDLKVSNVGVLSAQVSANGDAKEPKGGAGSSTTLQSSVSAYDEKCKKENHMMKQAVLADLAYVELDLENHLKALSVAKELLEVPDCSSIHIFLGHVYAAEALCRLNRPKEAAEQLAVYVSDGNTVELPYSNEDRERWGIEKCGDCEEQSGSVAAINTSKEGPQGIMFMEPEESRGALFVNFAATAAMQGNVEQAQYFLSQALTTIPNNPKAVLASVYVDLLLGRRHDALVKLRQCGHVRFFPSSVTTLTRS